MVKIKTIQKPFSMLDINLSLGVNEQKLLDILIHYLVTYIYIQNVTPKENITLQISIKRFHLHEFLDKNKKFKLSFYTKSLNKKNIRLNKTKNYNLFNSIDLTTQQIIFSLNPNNNTVLLKDGIFHIDADIHKLIKKKTSLAVYQIIISKLKRKNLNINEYKENHTLDVEVEFKEFIRSLGNESYSHVPSSEIFRSVNLTAMKELNELKIGFLFVERNCCTLFEGKKVKGFLFKIKLLNLEYLSSLLMA